jgi:hypothetical protein
LWKVGDVFIARGFERCRILDISPAGRERHRSPWTAEYHAVWTVEPV